MLPPPTASTSTTWRWGRGTPPTSGTGRPTTSSLRPNPPAVDDGGTWHPAEHRITSTTTTYFMRVLGHLAKQTVRSRPAGVSKLMAYIPAAVTAGYLREPDTELPLPGHEFARRINSLLAAADHPSVWGRRPSRPAPGPYTSPDTRAVDRERRQTTPEQMGTAKR